VRSYETWAYLNGTSRRRPPPLLAELGEIDLFVHDSSHTTRNLRFDLEHAWGAMRKGAIVTDDIERNEAFGDFTRSRPEVPSCRAGRRQRRSVRDLAQGRLAPAAALGVSDRRGRNFAG
jgi:hypothetical protein